VIQSSTGTTFYALAAYFGSVGIRRTRHAVTCSLLADLGGVVAAIPICYLLLWRIGPDPSLPAYRGPRTQTELSLAAKPRMLASRIFYLAERRNR